MKIETGVSEHADWGRGRHHRGGVDAGDVVAGVLVIGAIAAIAGAASSNSRNRARREEVRYPDRETYRVPARADYQNSRGIDSAVSMCVDQVERGQDRVDSVDNATRTSDGWRVSGSLDSGAGWNCWIDNDGRIRQIDLAGSQGSDRYVADNGRQLSDAEYARARAALRDGAAADDYAANASSEDLRPAYPGGPLPGEEGYEEAVQLSAAR